MAKRKVHQVREKVEVDYSTGEVTKHEYESVRTVDSEPPFVKLYIEDISRLLNIPTGAKDIIYCLLQIMDYQGYIGLNKAYKDLICEQIGIREQTFRNNMATLTKANILRLIGRGLYEMNPELFAKGGWKEIQKRRKNFRLVVDYTYDGIRSISAKPIKA